VDPGQRALRNQGSSRRGHGAHSNSALFGLSGTVILRARLSHAKKSPLRLKSYSKRRLSSLAKHDTVDGRIARGPDTATDLPHRQRDFVNGTAPGE
jgi:hypothetical protein